VSRARVKLRGPIIAGLGAVGTETAATRGVAGEKLFWKKNPFGAGLESAQAMKTCDAGVFRSRKPGTG